MRQCLTAAIAFLRAPAFGGVVVAGRRLYVGRMVAAVLAVATLALLLRALLTPATQPAVGPQPGPAAPEVGHYAPNAALLDLSGNHVDLTSLRGKVVVLNFWYASCEGCQLEMPALEQAYEQHKGQGLVVVGVNIADDPTTMAEYTRRMGITYPVFRDADGRTFAAYQVAATPSSYFVDRSGVIRYRVVGPLDSQTLNQDATPLLAR
jgi:peroxiredoxin